MKKYFTLLSLLLVCCSTVFAQGHESTTDQITIEDLTVNPGGGVQTITASVENISNYCAFGVEIFLPDGYEFVQMQLENDDEELEWMYASKGAACKTSHILKSALQESGSLKVTAYASTTFKASSTELFKIYVKANAWTKPGVAKIRLVDSFFTSTSEVQYDAADKELSVTTSTACTLPINVKAADKWGTITSPFEITAIPANITAYTIASTSGSEIKLTKASKIEAYKAYVLKASADVNTSINGTVDASAYEANVVGGLAEDTKANAVYRSQMVSGGPYVLQNQGEGAKFYAISGGIKVPAGKVFFHKEAGAKVLDFVVDEETDIKDIETIDSEAIYDIQGRRVETPKHGIYIVGGKKVRL